MDVYKTAKLVAGLLILTGLVAYFVSGTSSFTAFIPSILGLVIGLLTIAAQAKPNLSKHLMHGVAVVAVLGAVGSLQRVVPALMGGEIALPIAFAAQVVTAVLCVWLIMTAVKSFRAARGK